MLEKFGRDVVPFIFILIFIGGLVALGLSVVR